MIFDATNPVINWIFPRRCLVCDHDIQSDLICSACASSCNRCPNPLDIESRRVRSLFYFELTIRSIVTRTKYYSDPCLRRLLFTMIDHELRSTNILDEMRNFSPTVITYVPVHWLNRFLRGIDVPYLFAKVVARELKVPVVPMLRRNNRLRQAMRMRRSERTAAIKGSFSARNSIKKFSRVLLVDDIVTTGATFDEATRVLKNTCDKVFRLAIAKTP